MRRRGCFFWLAGLTLGALWITSAFGSETGASPDYWPTEAWRFSTPEGQGMDSEKLADMIQTIHTEGHDIRGIFIVRNGYLVADVYFHPFQRDTWHIIQSCTKSITSSLVGIAIGNGYIDSVNVPALALVPDVTPQHLDENKRDMTLAHLLMMGAGLDTRDSYLHRWQGLNEMTASSDWVRYVLDLPMKAEPGTRFEYSNGVAYTLGAITHQAVGKDLLDFAGEHLFGPLGINAVEWPKGPQGVRLGWTGIRMKPLDLAKIGLLYLNRGSWNDRRIISPAWIEAATSSQIHAGTLTANYGYQWWIDESGCYAALGYGGQYLVVCPEHNLVVTIVSALEEKDFFIPSHLLKAYIIPACVSSAPMQENPAGLARLQAITETAANPEPSPVPPLPEIAEQVSGRTYVLDPNPSPFKTISLAFEEGSDEATVSLAFGPKHIHVAVGLDGVYRITQSEGYWRAYRGAWDDDSTFTIDYQVIDYTERGKVRVRFREDGLTAWFQDYIADDYHELTAKPDQE
jgi:CubicO group peptidase (beta-lactamase class C family)